MYTIYIIFFLLFIACFFFVFYLFTFLFFRSLFLTALFSFPLLLFLTPLSTVSSVSSSWFLLSKTTTLMTLLLLLHMEVRVCVYGGRVCVCVLFPCYSTAACSPALLQPALILIRFCLIRFHWANCWSQLQCRQLFFSLYLSFPLSLFRSLYLCVCLFLSLSFDPLHGPSALVSGFNLQLLLVALEPILERRLDHLGRTGARHPHPFGRLCQSLLALVVRFAGASQSLPGGVLHQS